MKTTSRRRAYQVLFESSGPNDKAIGFKNRLVSFRRAHRIAKFLRERGHQIRVRYFGEINLPIPNRGFA